MRLLFDQNISFRVVKKVVASFPKSKHVSDCGLMGCEDLDIWEYARLNNYTIVSFDSDFYDISVINGHPPKVIWLRSGNLKTGEIANLVLHHKDVIEKFLFDESLSDISCLEVS